MSIEVALSKLRSAQICHPNAVQFLIDEAIAAIQQAEAQQPATAIACGVPGMAKTTCPYCEQGFAFEYEQPATGEPMKSFAELREKHRAGIDAERAKLDAAPEPVAWLYIEDGEVMFGHPNGYRPPDARPLVFGDTHPAPSVPDDVVRDAERYRWLADCNNYEAGLSILIDPKLTEHALGEAIDAAMLAASTAQKGGE